MTWIARTLWDLMVGQSELPQAARRAAPPRTPMQERYAALVREMKATYDVRVVRWRTRSSGCAWEVQYADGSSRRLVEAPYPRGPVSCAVFLHEIGHHAIGFGNYRLRCQEEYHAWRWALGQMRSRGFNVTDAVNRRMAESVQYAIEKARRRGLKAVPEELRAYVSSAITPRLESKGTSNVTVSFSGGSQSRATARGAVRRTTARPPSQGGGQGSKAPTESRWWHPADAQSFCFSPEALADKLPVAPEGLANS